MWWKQTSSCSCCSHPSLPYQRLILSWLCINRDRFKDLKHCLTCSLYKLGYWKLMNQDFLLSNVYTFLIQSCAGCWQPAFSWDIVAAASVQVGHRASMNTHRVVNVEPFRRVGLHKFAINEQLGGGLKGSQKHMINSLPCLVTSLI